MSGKVICLLTLATAVAYPSRLSQQVQTEVPALGSGMKYFQEKTCTIAGK
jgi:hypothetical protein